MKNILRFSALSALAAALTLSVSCGNEELDTDQYSKSQVKLVSYGPNPVMRGGTLTFVGSNLDKIVEVTVPGVDPITAIEVVKEGFQSEIRVALPAEGPEVGSVSLRTSGGKVFTTETELTYSEPIVIESFSPAKAYPRDVLTLKGDYMNLVKTVTFEGGTSVAVENIDRHNAKVTVPSSAVTGRIALSDEGEIANIIYSGDELQIGDPTVSSVKAGAWKPGETATVTGKYLDMIEEIRLAGDVTVGIEDLTVSKDFGSLTFTVPAGMESGKVTAVSYAGKEFEAGSAEMVVPTGLSVFPSSVTFGEAITISGKDLDVVTSVTFPNADAITEFTLSDGKINVDVPREARGGDIALTMASKDVVNVAYTLIKPAVTSAAPVELVAGDSITVKGTGLDFVESATLGGKAVEVKANEDGTELIVATASTSVPGKLVLTLYNGETIELEDEISLSYDSLIIVSEMPSAEHIGATVTLKGENFMMIENIWIGEAKVVTYTVRTDTELSFVMPWNVAGTYSMHFDLLNGDRETCPNQMDVQLEINYITAWEGNVALTWGDGGRVIVPASKFSGIKAGTKMRLYYTFDDDVWCQAQINYGDWSKLVFPEIGSETLVPACSWSGKGSIDWCTEVTLTADILAGIEAKKGDAEDVKAAGIIIQGSDVKFTKIEILEEIPQETVIWTGSFDAGGWAGNQDLAWGGFDWSTVEAGQKLIFYLTQDASQTWWQLSLRHGKDWGELPEKIFVEMEKGQTRVEVELSQTNLDDIVANGGLVITGCYYTLTEIALL